jgi:hypothetical protein
MNKTISRIKKIGASPLFLIASASYTAGMLAKIVGSTTEAQQIQNAFENAISSNENLKNIGDRLNVVTQSLPWSAIGASALGLIIALGMWLVFFSCMSSKEPPSTAGMTIIKVAEIINIVMVILIGLAVLALFAVIYFAIIAGVTQPDGSIPSKVIIVGIIIALVLIVAVVMVVMYFMGILKTMHAVKMTLVTGVIMGKVSTYMIVINYIIAICYILNGIFNKNIVIMIESLLLALSLITCSISVSKLKSEMLYIAARGSADVD